MSSTEWGALLPKQVADWINFDRDDFNWHYEGKESTSMASRQAEGVAYLWNRLSLHGVALLADEVGMGKTFQALGVAALLWKMKPDAKVLIMAPNRDICTHWKREFNTFVEFHYRHADHSVKNSVDNGPVPAIKECWRLEDLATEVESQAGHLYLTTIYSLSGLVPQEEKGKANITYSRNSAKKIRDRIKTALDGMGFDLVIIDEAHYFRNKNGQSQRVNAAEEFFGDISSPLTDKALLLTATPSHTSMHDIKNILSYFIDADKLANKSPEELMQNYGLRRFRRMQGIGQYHSKREYRKEQGVPCDFGDRPESEIFFALYQKKLVTELGFTRNNKSLLYGFLEGFESPGRKSEQINNLAKETEDSADEDGRKAFSKARDTKLLARLSDQYFTSFGKSPDHPKYGQLVETCVPEELFAAPRDLHEDKHLIFVRRIPSVRELTQRINEAYDVKLAAEIYAAWGLSEDDSAVKKWRATSWSRQGFNELVRKLQSNSLDDLEDDLDIDLDLNRAEHESAHEEGDAKLGSAISDLFVVKKGADQTDCSNVSLRFRKPESAFAMFLEPASDYMTAGYDYFYEYDQNGKVRADYITAAHDVRLLRHEYFTRKLESVSGRFSERKYEVEVRSVWSLVYPQLTLKQKNIIERWANDRPDIAENFSNYIKAGLLFASPVMVELYRWFTEFNRQSSIANVQEKYSKFIEFVMPKIQHSLLLSYFKNALDTFETVCEKISGNKPGGWENEWRSLKTLQNPAWYASGETGNRQRLILGFNSPFYPNSLVATSVFQEGVNLHLQCRKVHHYGVAGSPGDNEQRVGRVDRLFGKVNDLLKVDGLAELEINYPFLKSSVDEDQVASFIARKFHVEDKMDNCTQSSFDKNVELTRENWKDFLRTPVREISVKDPYEASFIEENLPCHGYVALNNHETIEIDHHLAVLIREVTDPLEDKLYVVEKNQHNPNAIFLIDPSVNHGEGKRWQPVLVEQNFSAEFSALVKGTVYYLSLTSPLASKDNLFSKSPGFEDKIISFAEKLTEQFPLVRLVIKEKAKNSHFYLHARVDLPVFAGLGDLTMLSKKEVDMAFQQLKNFSDQLEYLLFSGDQDLIVEELKVAKYLQETTTGRGGVSQEHAVNRGIDKWTKVDSFTGECEYLHADISESDFNKRYFYDTNISNQKSRLMRTLIINGLVPFINFLPLDGSQLRASVNYPSVDIQKAERNLLERWFDYAVPK